MRPRTLGDFVGDYRVSGDQLNYMVCPVCRSCGWNTYVNPSTGAWYCFAMKHEGKRGGKINTSDLSDERRVELLQQLRNPDGDELTWPEITLPAWKPLSDMAKAYLARREIMPSMVRKLGLVESQTDSRVIIPYYGPQHRIIHWVGRQYIDSRVTKKEPKYIAASGPKPMYMLPKWEPVMHAVLVEGPLDAIAVYHATKLPVISIGGTTVSKRIEHDIRKVVQNKLTIMLDGDAAVKAFSVEAIFEDRYKTDIVTLHHGEDPASIGERTLRFLLC